MGMTPILICYSCWIKHGWKKKKKINTLINKFLKWQIEYSELFLFPLLFLLRDKTLVRKKKKKKKEKEKRHCNKGSLPKSEYFKTSESVLQHTISLYPASAHISVKIHRVFPPSVQQSINIKITTACPQTVQTDSFYSSTLSRAVSNL